MFEALAIDVRYLLGMRAFGREKMTADDARRMVRERLEQREDAFLKHLEAAVYANPASPYLKLLRHAGFELADVRRLVGELGLEGALEHLYDAGVYVTLEEFKGREPVRRNGLEFPVTRTDFDNITVPANAVITTRPERAVTTSGSRGTPSTVKYNWSQAAVETAYYALLLAEIGPRPFASFSPRRSSGWSSDKLERQLQSQDRKSFSMLPFKTGAWEVVWRNAVAPAIARVLGLRYTRGEYVPENQIVRVAEWLAQKKKEGTPASLFAFTSPVVRICLSAREHGLDIGGTIFLVTGEPYTPAKARIVESVGATAMSSYGMAELGSAAASCLARKEVDEVHVFRDKLALIQREKIVPGNVSVPAIYHTALSAHAPKIMLNVESGDFARLEQRDCGCAWQKLGFMDHLSVIRSYEKLTSESVTFLGSELHRLLEEDLPERFGGAVTDYQLVEEEDEDTGQSRVSIVVAPGVGEIDEAAVVEAVMQTLRQSEMADGPWSEMWEHADTLRVIRRQPYSTVSSKIQPLHVVVPAGRS